jgi:isocitrate dehydrogenase
MPPKLNHPVTYIKGDQEGQVLLEKSLSILDGLLEIELLPFDLSLEGRLRSGDGTTRDAAASMRETKVGLKAPTITQGAGSTGPRLPSPNITLRTGIGGVAIVREAHLIPGVVPPNRYLTGPIAVIRKATEGIYEGMEWATEDGRSVYRQEFMTRGKMQALAEFAVAFAVEKKMVLWAATKHTISRTFEGTLQRILDDAGEAARRDQGLEYQSWLIDAVYQGLMRPPTRLAIVCDNFNGDCLGDLVPAMFGSVAGCGSILVGADGCRMFDPPHGTAPSLFGQDKANPLATLIALSGAVSYAASLAGQAELVAFGERIREAAFATIEAGIATFDLAEPGKAVGTSAFLASVRERLAQ